MENKICVYAICKNEMKDIDAWLTNMSEADYIVVLDTGSTDGTYEYLKKDKRCYKVKKKEIKPWRFDVARNESMKLVPDDANILVCTDQDERFEEGWAQVLRDNWQEDDTRCHYTYAWSHNEMGEPTDVFMYDKIHTRDYHWIFPVHEVLYPNEDLKEEFVFDAGENIYLHHLQNKEKERGSYFDLLKISVEENPEDSHCRMLLAREYLVREEVDNALVEYLACLDMPDIYEPNKKLVLLETLYKLSLIYSEKRDFPKAIEYCLEFLKKDTTHREPYFILGEIFNDLGLYFLAKNIVEMGIEKSIQHFDWVESRDNWIAKDKDILSIAKYYIGDYKGAVKDIKIALEHAPTDYRLLKNAVAFMDARLNELEEIKE